MSRVAALPVQPMGSGQDPAEVAQLLAPALKALSDENRLAILLSLAEKSCSVIELTSMLGLSQTLVSHHLKALRDCDLVTMTPVGRSNLYAVCCDALAEPIRILASIVSTGARSCTPPRSNRATDPKSEPI